MCGHSLFYFLWHNMSVRVFVQTYVCMIMNTISLLNFIPKLFVYTCNHWSAIQLFIITCCSLQTPFTHSNDIKFYIFITIFSLFGCTLSYTCTHTNTRTLGCHYSEWSVYKQWTQSDCQIVIVGLLKFKTVLPFLYCIGLVLCSENVKCL